MTSHGQGNGRSDWAFKVIKKAFGFFVSDFFKRLLGCNSVAYCDCSNNHILGLLISDLEERLGSGGMIVVHVGWFWLGVARGDEKTIPHMWNKLNRKMQNY